MKQSDDCTSKNQAAAFAVMGGVFLGLAVVAGVLMLTGAIDGDTLPVFIAVFVAMGGSQLAIWSGLRAKQKKACEAGGGAADSEA